MVMLCCNDRSVAIQKEQVELLRSRMVDGLIISPTGDDALLRQALAHCDVPVVLIDRVVEGLECDAVVIDNRAAVTEAMQYLLGLGHRQIGFVSGLLESFTGRERLAGYYAALDAAGIERASHHVQLGNFRVDEAYDAALRLMNGPNPPTAIFSSNNLMVIGVMKALRDLGLSCPEDVSVAGLDDFPWSDAFKPYLTTVEQPVRAIGERAAQLLLERMDGHDTQEARTIVLQGELKIRASCLPAAQVPTVPVSAAKQRRPALSGDPA
jgi:LacI family transcriptional regulator